jgi:hypothetical protein
MVSSLKSLSLVALYLEIGPLALLCNMMYNSENGVLIFACNICPGLSQLNHEGFC